MLTNDLKKGTPISLRNGWEAILTDSRKGNIREAKVFGLYTEIGSIYAHDIIAAQVNGEMVLVEYTPSQLKVKEANNLLFGE